MGDFHYKCWLRERDVIKPEGICTVVAQLQFLCELLQVFDMGDVRKSCLLFFVQCLLYKFMVMLSDFKANVLASLSSLFSWR